MTSRALLIGITYKKYPKYELKAPYNDLELMRNFLIDYYGFDNRNITALTDKIRDSLFNATFFNIVAYFSWGFVSSGVEYWRGGSYLLYFLRHPAETGMVVFCELRIIFICRRSMDVQHRHLMFTDISRAA